MPGFAGFDSDIYPGDGVMNWLATNSNLRWCGYYLHPAPSHGDPSWMGKRASLVAAGWGIAPVFVGEQVVGPGSHNPCAATGVTDGQKAAGLMQSEGFPAGSYVYLDIENGGALSPAQDDYLDAWCNGVTAGGYCPGIYCSHLNAITLHTRQQTARIWAWKCETILAHPVPNPFPDPPPSGCGYIGSHSWQLGQNCLIQAPHTITVDLDSSILADPSAPDPAFAAAPAAGD